MKTERWKKILGSLLACLLLAAALPTPTAARGVIDTVRPGSLTIQYPCPGITFRLYLVAEVSAYGEYTLTGDFRDDPVTLEQPDQAGWRALAATLDGYIARDERQPLATGETDENGQLTFSHLNAGLYLVTWQKHITDGFAYTPEPFLVSLPGLDKEDNWIYDVLTNPKYEQEKAGGDAVRRVLKVWKDGGDKSNRPRAIKVQLLQNGSVYDTVTLSEKNNWSYEWSKLNKDDTWQIVEIGVQSDYTVTVIQEGITFVVTNTLTTDIPDDPPPEDPKEPEDPGESIPDEPTPGDHGDPGESIPDEQVPQGPALPQTGVLWWPVPLLACGGMALFLVGWARRRSEECDEA